MKVHELFDTNDNNYVNSNKIVKVEGREGKLLDDVIDELDGKLNQIRIYHGGISNSGTYTQELEGKYTFIIGGRKVASSKFLYYIDTTGGIVEFFGDSALSIDFTNKVLTINCTQTAARHFIIINVG